MEKIPGCWEHLSMVWHSLKEARAQKPNLAIIWLDIANACSTDIWCLSTVDLAY